MRNKWLLNKSLVGQSATLMVGINRLGLFNCY
jgi:hypothetical protein